jgi:hypothetical protein
VAFGDYNMEKSAKSKKHVLRPLFWWLILVLVLYGIRTHQRLMETTRLVFTVTMQGQPHYEASATFDGKPAISGQKIPLGDHTFAITLPKGEPFSTNLFIWYGEHNFGTIDLKRTMGTLSVTADPPAPFIFIRGPEWSATLTNSSGLTQSVPTDQYTVESRYTHWERSDNVTVFEGSTTSWPIAPRFGAVQLSCNQSNATFQLLTLDDRQEEAGRFPTFIGELPEGNYKLISQHHGHQHEQTVAVVTGTTNAALVEFFYGAANLQTEPPDASVQDADGREWGVTPLNLIEILPGTLHLTLRRAGYEPVPVTLEITANQTATFSTNLISVNYTGGMKAAREFMSEMDYNRALQAVGDALIARPDDAEAMTLQREATGLGNIQHAKELAQQGDYFGGEKELKLALQSLPDNVEAKQLLADYKSHEPEQIERQRMERLELPKKSFDAALAYLNGANLFESHELKTGKSAVETHAAIETQLNVPPSFQIVRSEMTGEIFVIEATQDFPGGSRQCMIVGGQSKDDETQIFFKVVESKKVAFYNQPIGALMGTMPAKYTLIYPSDLQSNDKLRNQIVEGVSNVTDRIQIAIGQTPAVPQ